MCGIAGVYLRDGSAKADLDAMLDTMLDCIDHRGGDATGFVAVGDEGVNEWQKAACKARDFNRNRRVVPEGTRTILAHTRFATQGLPAFPENNHPLRRGSFYVVHNGHVSNDYKLFELAKREGFGQVDSEAIAARLASLGKLEAAGRMMSEIVGAAAIAAVDEANPGELLLARGYSSPLFVLTTKKYVIWGSTYNTVAEAYKEHIGTLPKQRKIRALKEGQMMHFVNGTLTESTFKPYSPPKVTKVLDGTSWGWKEVSTETYKQIEQPNEVVISPKESGDLGEELDCDGCGEVFPWNKLEYQQDEDGLTWMYCLSCSFEQEMEADTYARVNDFILAEGEPDSDED